MKKRKIDVIHILEYVIVCIILAYVIFLIVSRGGDAPAKEVRKAVLSVMKTDGMEKAGTQEFKRYYELNAKDYEDVTLYVPDGVMSVNELLIVRVKDDSQIETVLNAAEERLSTQKESFEGYGTDQTKLLNGAVLETRGQYVFMAVGKNAGKAYAAFCKSL